MTSDRICFALLTAFSTYLVFRTLNRIVSPWILGQIANIQKEANPGKPNAYDLWFTRFFSVIYVLGAIFTAGAAIYITVRGSSEAFGLERLFSWFFLFCPAFLSFLPADLQSKGSVINQSPDYHWAGITGSILWGALCWDIREVLGKKQADVVLRQTWFDLNENDLSDDVPKAFSQHLLARARDIENGRFLPALMEIFKTRGL